MYLPHDGSPVSHDIPEHENLPQPDSLPDNLLLQDPVITTYAEAVNMVHYSVCPDCHERVLIKHIPRNVVLCSRCRKSEKFTIANSMDPGNQPAELQDLSTVEQMLISQIVPTITAFRLPRGDSLCIDML